MDWEGIVPSADWMEEIHAAIDRADAFVFVISPDSVASRVCIEELAYAEQHQKRLIPIVRRDVPTAAVPAALQRLNWLFFRETDA